MGQTATFTDNGTEGTIKLNSIRRMQRAEGPLGGTPKNGSYLVANFTVQITAGSFDMNPLSFSVQSEDGSTFQSELGVLNNQMPTSTVAAGRKVRGDVAFDAQKGPLLVDLAMFGPPLATFAVKG